VAGYNGRGDGPVAQDIGGGRHPLRRLAHGHPTEACAVEVTGPSIAVRAALPAGTDDATVTCTWGFGDGDVATGTSAVHTYAAEGTYVVTLTVTSESGATSTASRTIDVGAAAGTPQGADGRDGTQPAPAS
jgi:hypothetical protein